MTEITNLKVKSIRTLGVKATYTEKKFIEDENHPEGGEMQSVTMYYDKPRILMDIELTTEPFIPLGSTIGWIFIDEHDNLFMVMDNITLRNMYQVCKEFTFPTKLTLLSAQSVATKSVRIKYIDDDEQDE